MPRRYNLARFILVGVVVLGLALLMVGADPSAQIVFSSNREGNYEIYVIDADGGQPRNLTKDIGGDYSPSWSPDGKHIAFVSNRDGNSEIYVINTEGRRHPRRLTNNNHDDIDPAWFDPTFAVEVAPAAVAPAGKKLTLCGWFKQVDR